MEFKVTKGILELKYVSGICIGIGTVGDFSQMTANTILPETDEDYEKERIEIESNMLLYSKAPEMLEMLKYILNKTADGKPVQYDDWNSIEQLIKEATEL